jgi:hypothetical protein
MFSAGRTASREKVPLGSLKIYLFIKIHKFKELAFNGRQRRDKAVADGICDFKKMSLRQSAI